MSKQISVSLTEDILHRVRGDSFQVDDKGLWVKLGNDYVAFYPHGQFKNVLKCDGWPQRFEDGSVFIDAK